MKGYWKVPFRQVYCESLRIWLAEVIHCHVYYRLNHPKLPPLGTEETS